LTAAGPDDVVVQRFERRAMGSPLRLTVVDLDRPSTPIDGADTRMEAAWAEVSAAFEAAEAAMSRFRESSDLTAINRAAGSGVATRVDRLLARALVAADRAGRLTDGRFDARVLGDLERLGYPGAAVAPTPSPPVEPNLAGRWLSVDVRSSDVSLEVPVDLGGIGKGLALRWAARAMDRNGLASPRIGFLLEAGGDLVGRAPSPAGGDWSLAIEDPAGGEEPKAVVGLRSGAIATSSIAINRWHDGAGRPVHHLIDPRTGDPGGEGLWAVTVAGSDPAWAEVWSKSLFLAGVEGIGPLARSRGLASWWIRADGELEMTPAARLRTTWTATDP
jgi:thiamine biosynthesis lipoprotein